MGEQGGTASAVSTTAKAGMARTQSTTTAKISFASGTGVDQSDPEHVQTSSTVRIDFNLVWDTLSSENRGRLVRAVIERVEVDQPQGDVRTFIANLGASTETLASTAGARP